MSKVIEVKCVEPFFGKLKCGNKTFEARLNDREYEEGDTIVCNQFDPERGFTGERYVFTAGFILYGPAYGIQEGYCVISVIDHPYELSNILLNRQS